MACGIGLVLANLLVLTVANTNAQDTDLRLIVAVKRQDTEAVRVLLEEPVNVDASQVDGATALHWAAYLDDVDTLRMLRARTRDSQILIVWCRYRWRVRTRM